MLFHSSEFLFFFLLIFPIYWLSQTASFRRLILLAASYWFYMAWDVRFGALMFASTFIDYVIGLALDRYRSPRTRKLLICSSVIVNLSILGFFKYFNFFQSSLEDALGVEWSLLNIILPVGISFYTFQSLSYTIDVYRREIPTERNFVNFALFVVFFPQLIAGPILRASQFLPQLYESKAWKWDALHSGLAWFIFGLGKKLLIADNLAPFVDTVFSKPEIYSAATCYLALVSFAVQIYCDFSGYSDMAIGLALCFGYRLPENFRMPYLARNPSEFWQRWNITLSGWLRDYLYIPLGGNRCGPWRTKLNLLITMLLGGLWHGANWTFVAWGLFHACWLILYHSLKPTTAKTSSPLFDALSTIITFHLVLFSWIFFRSDNFSVAWQFLQSLTGFGTGQVTFFGPHIAYLLAIVGLAHFCGAYFDFEKLRERFLTRVPAPAMGFVYFLCVIFILLFSSNSVVPFIYFQF
jgi:alginate O-acetyltransferase complex protein AlgI